MDGERGRAGDELDREGAVRAIHPDDLSARTYGAARIGRSITPSVLEGPRVRPKAPGVGWARLARDEARRERLERPVMANPPLVSVVDDDDSVRESLPDLLRELAFDAEAFASAEAFLASGHLDRTRCLVLDVTMPGMTGPELQEELARRGRAIPIVFITAHQDESIRARVLAAGAVACLAKPFSDTALLAAVSAALGVGS